MSQHDCQYCKDEATNAIPCPAVSPDGMIGCTRAKGHEGKHAACGVMDDEHPIIAWNDEVSR